MKEVMMFKCTKCKRDVKPVYDLMSDVFRVKDKDVKATIQILKCPYCGTEIWDKYNEMDNEAIINREYEKLKENK